MEIEVFVFDKDLFECKKRQFASLLDKREMMSPIDYNWDYFYKPIKMETSKFERIISIGHDGFLTGLELIEIDNDILYRSTWNDRLFSYSEMLVRDESLGLKTFGDGQYSKILNRKFKLKKLLE